MNLLTPSTTIATALSLLSLAAASGHDHDRQGPPGINRDPICFGALSTPDQEIVPNGTDFVVPKVDSSGFAEGTLEFDRGLTQATVRLQAWKLVGKLEKVHIHCGVAGESGGLVVDVFPGVLEADLNAGVVQGVLRTKDILLAESCPGIRNIASLKAAAESGGLYFNIHTDAFPAGELRGQIQGDGCDYTQTPGPQPCNVTVANSGGAKGVKHPNYQSYAPVLNLPTTRRFDARVSLYNPGGIAAEHMEVKYYASRDESFGPNDRNEGFLGVAVRSRIDPRAQESFEAKNILASWGEGKRYIIAAWKSCMLNDYASAVVGEVTLGTAYNESKHAFTLRRR